MVRQLIEMEAYLSATSLCIKSIHIVYDMYKKSQKVYISSMTCIKRCVCYGMTTDNVVRYKDTTWKGYATKSVHSLLFILISSTRSEF